ncbi:hypothetical protein SLA2020_054960 [Shorea laevis]
MDYCYVYVDCLLYICLLKIDFPLEDEHVHPRPAAAAAAARQRSTGTILVLNFILDLPLDTFIAGSGPGMLQGNSNRNGLGLRNSFWA